jgi:methylmalonyl-CoA/ethylmalonyl-CoA epimerase
VTALVQLHHVGFVVASMERGVNRFMSEGASLEIDPTEDPVQGVWCALLRLADDTAVELVAPIDQENSPVTGRLKRGGGLDHLCFSVPNLEEVVQSESDCHELVVCPPTFAVTFQTEIAFVQRRSGLLIEYMQEQS